MMLLSRRNSNDPTGSAVDTVQTVSIVGQE